MSIDSESFTRYAKAEKECCEKVGAMLAKTMQEIEAKHGNSAIGITLAIDRN